MAIGSGRIAFFVIMFFIFMLSVHAAAAEKEGNPKMEQVLYQLAKSGNPGSYAVEKRITLVEDKIRVIIILANENNISGRFNITIEEQDKNLVQALVPVNELMVLANDSDINYIKVPERFNLLVEEKPRQSSFPWIFSWAAVIAIFLFMKIGGRR